MDKNVENEYKSFQPMIAQFINPDGKFELIENEDVVVSNGELVRNKSKIAISQSDGKSIELDQLYDIARIIQTQAGINNQERTVLDVAEAEGIIEADFLTFE